MGERLDPFDFPKGWEADVVLSDGGTVHLRPVVPSDADALLAFHGRMSERTRYLRYFGAYPQIPPRDLVRFTTVDHRDRVAFVARLGDDIVAVARYERIDRGPSAEVAFVVEDRHQSGGWGRFFSSILRRLRGNRGLSGSSPRCLPRTGPCLGFSGPRVTTLRVRWKRGSFISSSPSIPPMSRLPLRGRGS